MTPLSARAQSTFYFVPTLDEDGNISELWSYIANWYSVLTPMPVPANAYPGSGDTVIIELGEYACVVDVPMVEIGTLITAANIEGGDFLVQYVYSENTEFNGTTLDVQYEWDSSDDQMLNGSAIIQSGALLLEDGSTLSANNSTFDDIGQIELMDGADLEFTGGTNQLTIAPNAQFTSIGDNMVANGAGNPLTFDNNGTVQSQDGTLVIESDSVFWTNSSGQGYFTNITSNAVIEVWGPFEVQTNCTNFITGPGAFELYVGTSIIVDGILQVGTLDPSPGNLDYRAYNLTGAGAVNISGSPGMPSSLIWESGTFEGPPINIDSNSLLIITNPLYAKTVSDSVIYNFGTTLWETNGGLLDLDNGAVFDNIGTFIAENNSDIQGGAGANESFFNNGGTFLVDLASNNLAMNFTQDNEPAPSAYFVNAGQVDVQTGALYLEWGTNNGQCNVAQGCQLQFWSGTNTQKANASFTGPGAFIIQFADVWLDSDLVVSNLEMVNNANIDGPGNLAIDGLFTVASGTIKGSGSLTINRGATMNVATNGIILDRNVTNEGNVLVTNSGVQAGQSITWVNMPGSSLDLAGTTLSTYGTFAPPPALINEGTLSNLGPSLTTTTVGWFVTNSGTIVAYPFALDINEPVTQTAGTIDVEPGASFSVSGAYGTTFQVLGGTVEGQGTVGGLIYNSGTIHPGDSPGILTFGFGYVTNEPGAELAIDIAGTTPGAQYSQATSGGGQVWLNNMGLAVTFDNGFVPTLGDSFVIWTNASISGEFSSLTGLQASPGVVLVPQYTPNTVTLVAANEAVLLSPSISDGALTFSLQTTAGLTNLIQYTPSLSPADWQPLTNIVGDGLIHFVMDNLSTNGSRFYRAAFE